MFRHYVKDHLYALMIAETLSKNICVWTRAVQDCYISHSRKISKAWKTFGKAEALNVVYASGKE